jgi:hypothetical protein
LTVLPWAEDRNRQLDHFGDRFNFAIAANGDIDRDRTIAAQGVAECQGLVMHGPFARGEIGNHHDKRKPKERLCLASYRFPPRINFLALILCSHLGVICPIPGT